jgi:hypothetical protein
MDVYLIPTTTSARYELYYEAPDEPEVDDSDGTSVLSRLTFGLSDRLKRRFDEMLLEAEEWRRRRHETAPVPDSVIGRARRKIMGFIVERIAEQRLLWQLRKATRVCAHVPADLSEQLADEIIGGMLKRDHDHHFKWLWIDLLLLALSAPLMVIPGPNLPGFYFTFQVVSHTLSWRGARRGLALSPWRFEHCAELSELREVMTLPPPQRQHHFHDVATRLRLEHLPTFLEDVAARPA